MPSNRNNLRTIMGGRMSRELVNKYNLDESDFWTIAGKVKVISFDGVIKIIDEENIKFEMSDKTEFIGNKITIRKNNFFIITLN